MDEKGGYCGFPIQLLRKPKLDGECNDIIGASALHFLAGEGMVKTRPNKAGWVVVEPNTEEECEKRARKALRFENGSLYAWEVASSRLSQFLASVTEERALWVRVPTSMIFEVMLGDMSERDFRTHVALLSVVGVRTCARVSGDVIAARSAGYLRKVPAAAEVRSLSRWQIDAALDVLRARALWSVVNFRRQGNRGGGERWFSNRLTPSQLVEQVMARKNMSRLGNALSEEAEAWAKHREAPQDPRKSPASGPQPTPQVPPQVPPHV